MTKPVIVTRAGKGSALTWTEGDSNFTNLQNATLTVKAGTGGTDVVSDLNGTVTLVAGTNVTLSGDNTAKTVTINASGGSGSPAGSNQQIQYNSSGSFGASSGLVYDGTSIKVNGNLESVYTNGDEGGEIFLNKPTTNTSITTGVTIDVNQNRLRFFENGGTNRGYYVDITAGAATAGSKLITDVVQDTSPQLGGNLDIFDGTTERKIFNSNASNVEIDTTGGTLYLTAGRVDAGTGTDLVLASPSGAYIQVDAATNGNITLQANGTGDVYVQADTLRVGDLNASATITTSGTGDLIFSTNSGTNSGSIRIFNGANGNIELSPNGTGDVYLSADTVRVGDANAAATITTNGTGNLVLNTNSGTNSGSITIAQGANGNITYSPNGSGSNVFTGPSVATTTATGPGSAALTARNAPSPGASGTVRYPSLTLQKHRTDIALASMSNEPAVMAYSVRDSSSVNRIFATHRAVYQGTGSNPYFSWDTSIDGFTNTIEVLTMWETTARFGGVNSNYTITTNGTGNLTLSTNSGTNSGTIVINQGANANIDLTPNGTGSVRVVGAFSAGTGSSAGQIYSTGTQDLELRTGGANLSQITLGGASANGNITLTPNGTGRTVIKNLNYYENVYAYGNSGTLSWAPDVAGATASNIVTMTLTGNLTFNGFTNPISGQTLTVVLTQDATGGRTLTSTMKFAGGSKTLSTAANSIDILTVSYIGTTYYATLSKGYA